MNKKVLAVAALGLLFYGMSGKKEDTPVCSGAFFKVNGQNVCDELLPSMGYGFWVDGKNGTGWYSLDNWLPAKFGMSNEAWKNLMSLHLQTLINPSKTAQQRATAQNYLNQYFVTGSPLVQA